jgi:hypothetical protein
VTDYTINADRGEVGVTLSGKLYPLRPSYEAQMAIEAILGVSIDELFTRVRRYAEALQDSSVPATGIGLKLRELAVIVAEGMKAAGKDRGDKDLLASTAERCAELIVADRFSFTDPVTNFLMAALFGGADPEKKEPAEPVA